MIRFILPSVLLTTTLAIALPAQATGSLTRTFVSSAGHDSNPCTITQPCATFAVAYAATAANGIIAALDPGKYGPLTIIGPVTINGNGWAAITVPAAGNGITINANPGDAVALRGLILDGAGAGNSGIQFNSGVSLTVDDCIVSAVAGDGIEFFPNAGAVLSLSVANSDFNNNGGAGILIKPSSAAASAKIRATVERAKFFGNGGTGLLVNGANAIGASASLIASVTDSAATNNGTAFGAQSGTGGAFTLFQVTRCEVTGNGFGVNTVAGGVIYLAQSVLMGNGTAYNVGGGAIFTYGDNYIPANFGISGQLSTIGKQ